MRTLTTWRRWRWFRGPSYARVINQFPSTAGVIVLQLWHSLTPARVLFYRAKVGEKKRRFNIYYIIISVTGCRISFYLIITSFPRRCTSGASRVVFLARCPLYTAKTWVSVKLLSRANEKIIPVRGIANIDFNSDINYRDIHSNMKV